MSPNIAASTTVSSADLRRDLDLPLGECWGFFVWLQKRPGIYCCFCREARYSDSDDGTAEGSDPKGPTARARAGTRWNGQIL